MEENQTFVKHVQVPDSNEYRGLKPTDKLVYANIRRFMNKDTMTCYPSMSTIAKFCDVTEPTVKAAIKRLVKFGYIEILPEKHNSKNNIYKFKKLEKDFERFTDEFLDNPDLTSNEKAYLIGLQSQCYKDGKYAVTSYSNNTIANNLDMSLNSVKKYNTSLKAKEVMKELQSVSFDENGFAKVVKAIDMAKIGQQVLFEVAVNHENRIQQLETLVEKLMKDNHELNKQLQNQTKREYEF